MDSLCRRITPFYLCSLWLLFFLVIPQGQTSPGEDEDFSGEIVREASTLQAQQTLASLFGRGSKMPEFPEVKGAIAIPSFDSSNMAIHEDILKINED